MLKLLEPGESYSDLLYINQVYDLSRPGRYVIRASRTIPRELGEGTVKSNEISVTLIP
jgi:hypothetical protein